MVYLTRRFVLASAVLGLMVGQARAGVAVVFDNGPADPTYTTWRMDRISGLDVYSVSDDFVLSEDTVVTGFDFDTWHLADPTYLSTNYAILDGLPGSGAQVIASGTVAAAVASNGLVSQFNPSPGFLHSIGGLSISLAAGTYYLQLSENISGGVAIAAGAGPGSAQTVGGGLYQSATGSDLLRAGDHLAFRIYGESAPTTAVPEPASLATAGLGVLLALGYARRRRRTA